MTRRLPTKQLLRLGDRAIHVLKYLEKAVHPRWPMTFEVAKHAVGVMVLLLTVVLLLTPVPLSNVAPAMVISLISLAYVEEDGFVLSAAFLAAIIVQNSSSLAPARLFFRHATRSTVNGRVGWTDGKWTIYAAGFVIWLFGYLSAGHPSLIDWRVATPWWISSFIPNVEAELGLGLMLASMVPLYVAGRNRAK